MDLDGAFCIRLSWRIARLFRRKAAKDASARFLQPLRKSALRPRVSDQSHVPAVRRNRNDGLPPLHRLPAVHGRLSLRGTERTKGVVEKCNFCEERLAKGTLPACVLACRQKALTFGDADDPRSDIRRLLETRFSLRRRAHLGTGPQIYYLL